MITNGVGTGSSRAGESIIKTPCDSAGLRAPLSVPLSGAKNLALAVKLSGRGANNTPARFAVQMGGRTIGEVRSVPTSFDTAKVCIPAWARGMVWPVDLGVPVGSVLDCSAATTQDIFFDDLAWVNDDSCAAPSGLADPGFERTDLARPWIMAAATTSNVSVVSDAAAAHGGLNALQFTTTKSCAVAVTTTTFRVPEPVPGRGPAIKLWYRWSVDANVHSELAIQQDANALLKPTKIWTQATSCIAPSLGGRPATVMVRFMAPGSCGVNYPAEQAYVDDVEVVLDPTCPSQ
jgi:hypothetical protein